MKDEELRLSCLEKDYRLDQVLDKIQLKEVTAAMSKIMGASVGQINSEKVQRIQGKQERSHPQKKMKKIDFSDSNDKSGNDVCRYCGSKRHSGGEQCPARERKCNKCNKFGHYAKVCRTKNVKLVDDDRESLRGKPENSDSDECVFGLQDRQGRQARQDHNRNKRHESQCNH